MEAEQVRFIVLHKLLECEAAVARPPPAASFGAAPDGPQLQGWFDVHDWAYSCTDALMRVLTATHDAAKAERLKHTATVSHPRRPKVLSSQADAVASRRRRKPPRACPCSAAHSRSACLLPVSSPPRSPPVSPPRLRSCATSSKRRS